MARVTLEQVTKRFGDVTALCNVSLVIEDQEFLVLVGPSGCGKSTLLRTVAGLEELTGGYIYIGDRLVNDMAPKDRDIAMVFQNYALYPHMNVYENMAFALKLRGFKKPDIDRRVRAAADILGIGDLLGRKPKELSGGQRQRVALGRAIVREPAVFLLDEPLSNLDAKLRVQMRTEIAKLHQRLKTTMIYVTHDQTEAMTLGDRIAVMKDGIIHQVAPPREIYDSPKDIFVAGFIGSPPMNFISCKVAGPCLVGNGFNLPLPKGRERVLRALDAREVVLGLRPEHISDVAVNPSCPSEARVECRVEVVEPLGAEVYLHLLIGGQPLTARVNPDTQARAGETLQVTLDLDRAHFFDAGSGLAIR